MTINCTFCRIQVGNRRPAAAIDDSLLSMDVYRSRPHPRIDSSPLPPSNSPLPSFPSRRPVRIRRRPRHFDSSPDLDKPRRCENMVHFPSKVRRDFIDSQGRMHPICNECRQNDRRPLALPILSPPSEDDENQPTQGGHPLSLNIQLPARQPLQDVTIRHVNIGPSQGDQPLPSRFCLFSSPDVLSIRGATYGRYRPSQDYADIGLEFTDPALWNQSTQTIVDGFRRRLANYRIQFCRICSRLQSFDSTFVRSPECSHCKNQQRNGRTSNFGADNDMDPGDV